jgi:hypothetical protein
MAGRLKVFAYEKSNTKFILDAKEHLAVPLALRSAAGFSATVEKAGEAMRAACDIWPYHDKCDESHGMVEFVGNAIQQACSAVPAAAEKVEHPQPAVVLTDADITRLVRSYFTTMHEDSSSVPSKWTDGALSLLHAWMLKRRNAKRRELKRLGDADLEKAEVTLPEARAELAKWGFEMPPWSKRNAVTKKFLTIWQEDCGLRPDIKALSSAMPPRAFCDDLDEFAKWAGVSRAVARNPPGVQGGKRGREE